MLINKNTFNLKSMITDDWGGSHRLVINLEALGDADNWKIGLDIPKDYQIKEFYSGKVIQEEGKTYLTGAGGNKSMTAGDKVEIVLIVDEGNSTNLDPIAPQFMFADSVPNSTQSDSVLDASSSIVEDWNGGYKLELDITAKSEANNWQVDFNTPHKIREFYHVDLIDNGDGNYTIKGQNGQTTLYSGQSVEPVLIMEDGGQEAVLPQFDDAVNVVTPQLSQTISTPISTLDIPNTNAQSVEQTGKFAYGEALQKNFLFLEANRSGPLPADNRLEWRSDATTNDGADVGVDLNGGYFDAGDHIKFIQPMAFSSTMLAWSGADYKDAYANSGQLDELLEAVKWGTDWFLKAHQMNDGGQTEKLYVQVGDRTDHYHWVTPEEITNYTERPSFYIDATRPGSDAAAGTASALASASVLFRGVDDAYADELVKNAEALYEFAETYRGKYSDSVPEANPFYTSWSGEGDELALGGAWLYRATGKTEYLTKAEDYFKTEVGSLGDWSYASDDHSYAAATLLAKESSDPMFKSQTTTWLDTWVNGGGNVSYTEGGFAHRANWASVPLNMSAAFSAEWYNDHVEANSGYSDFASNQVDYVLGDNPADFSYVVGFGDNYSTRTHHRGSAGTAPMDGSSRENDNILYGAVVGGPEYVDDFSHNDRRDDWITNEVGTSYNAPFAGASIQQYDNFGGDALSESDLDALIGVDADGVGF